MSRIKIVQVIHGVDKPYAGPTYSVAMLAEELYRSGQDAGILTLGNRPSSWPYKAPLRVHGGLLESRVGISLSLMRDISRLAQQPLILHGHGIWRLTNLFPLFLRNSHKARIVWSPRGAMSMWSMKYKRYVKMPFWYLLQRPALQRIHCFHVTAQSEYEDVRRTGLRFPAAIIPNGIDIPALQEGTNRHKRVVFLGRINPVKGVDMLIRAWSEICNNFPEWELVIAGPLSDEYANAMRRLAVSQSGASSIRFTGQLLGREKTLLLSEASLFVLPSYSENFGIAVAEALAHGLPVITTTATPWAEVVSRRCGWCIPPEQISLASTLQEAMSRPLGELENMGLTGRAWMRRDYSWEHVAGMMLATYEWLLHGTNRPDFVVDL